MEIYNHTFENIGTEIYNDVVYPKLFNAEDSTYNFLLSPKSIFWRLGIRLSKTETIEFFHPSGRYTRPQFDKYIDIHLGVGEWDGTNWSLPKRIHLAQYNLEKYDHILDRQETYIETGDVKWEIKFDQNKRNVNISYSADGCNLYSNVFEIPTEHKYFQVFAWADEMAFKIDVQIQKDSLENVTSKTVFIEAASQFSIADNFNPVIEVNELAAEIGDLLKLLKDDKGNMFGIFGKWGRGKTFLWQKIWNYLSKEDKNKSIEFLNVEFHAWKYQNTPALWAYLYETLSNKYFETKRLKNIEYKNWFKKQWYAFKATLNQTKLVKRLRLNFFRLRFRPIISFLLLISIPIIWTLIVPSALKIDWAKSLIKSLGLIGFASLIYLYTLYKPKARNILNMYSGKVSYEKYLGLQAEIQKEIRFLMKAWISKVKTSEKKVLLFVDDIDRCNEDKIIHVVDSLRIMLEDPEICKRIIVITALDERVLKMAIKSKYYDLVEKTSNQSPKKDELLETLSKEYIDKIFIAGVKLGDLSSEEKIKIFDTITFNKISKLANNEAEVSDRMEGVLREDNPAPQNLTVSVYTDFDSATFIQHLESDQFDISEKEEYRLKEALLLTQNMTPRSIRIFYYRYMLAKKIINYKFKKGSYLYLKWYEEENNKKILPYLIIYYSENQASEKITETLVELEKITNKKTEV